MGLGIDVPTFSDTYVGQKTAELMPLDHIKIFESELLITSWLGSTDYHEVPGCV